MRPHTRQLRTTVLASFACTMGLGWSQPVLSTTRVEASEHPARLSAATPDGDHVLIRSFAAMQKSLHAVHSEATARQDTHKWHAGVLVSGDCMMAGTTHHGQVWERGTKLYSTVVPVNLHFIEIGPQNGGSLTWRRGASTGNRWRVGAQPGREEDAAVLFLTACPLQQSFLLRQKDRPHLTNLGPARIRGLDTWHLHVSRSNSPSKGMFGSYDLYIEQHTGRWVRSSSVNGMPDYREHDTIEYSRFNESIAITAPHVGSATP
jgi:hypothetical protein